MSTRLQELSEEERRELMLELRSYCVDCARSKRLPTGERCLCCQVAQEASCSPQEVARVLTAYKQVVSVLKAGEQVREGEAPEEGLRERVTPAPGRWHALPGRRERCEKPEACSLTHYPSRDSARRARREAVESLPCLPLGL